jgi:hypothetical protein
LGTLTVELNFFETYFEEFQTEAHIIFLRQRKKEGLSSNAKATLAAKTFLDPLNLSLKNLKKITKDLYFQRLAICGFSAHS